MMTAMGYPTHYLDVRPDYKVVCGGGSGGPVQKFLSWMIIYLEFGFAHFGYCEEMKILSITINVSQLFSVVLEQLTFLVSYRQTQAAAVDKRLEQAWKK